jgi:hypothetical protein
VFFSFDVFLLTISLQYTWKRNGAPSLDVERFGIEIVKEDKRNEKAPKLPSQSLERNMQFGKKKG